jgi:hypothetical protein
MPDLILSDITVMGPGYCVIGLEEVSPNSYRSVRPMPPWGFAWREPFPFKRGDRVRFQARPTTVVRPHLEDQNTSGLIATGTCLDEGGLIQRLRGAEVGVDLQHLFACAVQTGSRGGGALWVNAPDAARSICGCEYENLRFRLYPEPPDFTLRAELVVSSKERIPSIPIVDSEWRRFVSLLVRRIQRANPLPLAERFLNWSVARQMLVSLQRFARIGLPRPKPGQPCWLMLDSLFPQPRDAWLDLL